MKKLSARDVQIFVAGALALTGFQALIKVARYFVDYVGQLESLPRGTVIGLVIEGLALPLGINILVGSTEALRWTRIFLRFWVFAGLLSLLVYCASTPSKSQQYIENLLPEILVYFILLGLISWSGTQGFRDEPPA